MSNYLTDNLLKFRQPVEMPGGWSFDHPRTLRRINLYLASKYETGELDSQGYRKFFFNIVRPACDIASKFIDLDTKDVVLHGAPHDEWRVWLMQKDLVRWMKENGFAELLNELKELYPQYGTIVVKKTAKGLKNVRLENLRMDPASPSLKESPFVYEYIGMTASEIRTQKSWDQEAVEELLAYPFGVYAVYDCYDAQEDGWKHCIYAEPFLTRDNSGTIHRSTEASINKNTEYLPALKLYEGITDELPYREKHFARLPGRWLGYGFVEYLFDNQIAENERENLERKALHFKALHLWYTSDEMLGANALTDMVTGQILKTSSEIKPLQKDPSDLAVFHASHQRWTKNTEQKTFSFDIARGENLPSRTPLGVANLSAGMVASYFEGKREDFGLFIRELILKDVIPDFLKTQGHEHVLLLLGNDKELAKWKKVIVEAHTASAVMDYYKRTGFFPEKYAIEEARMNAEEFYSKHKNLEVVIPKSFYEDAVKVVDVVVTGEQFDVGTRNQTILTVLQMLAVNPAIVQNPITRSMLFALLQMNGVSPVDFDMTLEEEAAALPLPQGGSISIPQAVPAPRTPMHMTL